MNSVLSKQQADPLLPRERELLKTISKLVRKAPDQPRRLEELVEISGLPLTSLHRTIRSLEKKGWLGIEKVSGMRFTVKEPS